jgi:hypothetical protein
MACVCEDDDRKRSKSRDGTSPPEYSHFAPIRDGVTPDVMGKNQYYKVCNGAQSNHTRVFERVQTSQKRQGNNDEPGNVRGSSASFGEVCSYMKAVIQNCRSCKNAISPAPGAKPRTTPGIKSPMMMR